MGLSKSETGMITMTGSLSFKMIPSWPQLGTKLFLITHLVKTELLFCLCVDFHHLFRLVLFHSSQHH